MKIIRKILLALCGIIIGANLYSLNSRNLIGNQLPMPFGFGSAVILSGSMEPSLSIDDWIFIKETNEYNKNDIVVFQEGRILVVHRIVELQGESVITKGDANNANDAPINISNVKGKVIFHIPYVGKIINLIKTPLGSLITIVVAFLLIETSNIKEKREREQLLKEIEEIKNKVAN